MAAVVVQQPHASTSTSPLEPFAPAPNAQSTRSVFEGFRAELDAHQERRERLIKLSRDCTALSKKLIFLLHRVTQQRNPQSILAQAETKNAEILDLLKLAAPDLQEENLWRYLRAISPGIEEWIEGLTFLYFLRISLAASDQASGSPVMPFSDIRQTLLDAGLPELAVSDYLGGLGDLTGELMRLGISRISSSGGIEAGAAGVGECERWVRAIKQGMDPLIPHLPKLAKKMSELQASLRKLENASYTLALRGEEYKERLRTAQVLADDQNYPADIKKALLEMALSEQKTDDREEA